MVQGAQVVAHLVEQSGMKSDPAFEVEVKRLLQERVASLRRLTPAEVATRPEANGEKRIIGGYKCTFTVLHQLLKPNRHLVTVQVARPTRLGMASSHWEQGLVFVEGDEPRDATEEELRDTGG